MPYLAPLLEWRFVSVTVTRSLLLTDAFQYLNVDNAGAINITVPDPADVAFELGTQIALEQVGAGVFTLVAGANVTINSRGALLASNTQFAVVSLALKSVIAGAAIWTAFGDTA